MKTRLQRPDQDSDLISLIDFVDSHPSATDGSTLLEIGLAIVQETRNQVHEFGLWPTLTPDQIFVKAKTDGWGIRFGGFGTYSKGEVEGESPHRAKCVRDIYRITYFLGTGEFPLQVEPLLGKPFNRRKFPHVPKRLLSLYKMFFVLDPAASPRTLLDIQWAMEKRKRSRTIFGPVGLVCWTLLISCIGGVSFLKYSSEIGATALADSGTIQETAAEPAKTQPIAVVVADPVSIQPELNKKRIQLAPQVEESIEYDGPTIAEIRSGIPRENFPTPDEQFEDSPLLEVRLPIGNGGIDQISHSVAMPSAILTTLNVASLSEPVLVDELKQASFPESRVEVRNQSETIDKLSLEWIRNGNSSEKAQALEWLREAHREGNGESTYILAECYFYGVAVEKNENRSITLLNEALALGSGKAALMLGTAYSKGVGVDVDYSKARVLYKKAINERCFNAYGNLGVLQLRGQGGESNAEEAVENFRKGAVLGDSIAAFYLAKCLDKGIGGEVNKEEASKWYSIAASKGHPGAVELCVERNISISAVTSESL